MKPSTSKKERKIGVLIIAIVLTACGIETYSLDLHKMYLRLRIAIVLTACGIETVTNFFIIDSFPPIAIVLTACGIETVEGVTYIHFKAGQLQ